MSIRSAEKLCASSESYEGLTEGAAKKKDIVEERMPPTFGFLNRIVIFVFLVMTSVASALLAWNLFKMERLNEQFEFIFDASNAVKLYAALRIELRQFINYANYEDSLATETFTNYY